VKVKVKRKPSAYNLFVKEHMKVYLAEHPGKTNKDAMKHVCLTILSNFLIPHQVFRSARFGKMHRKIQSVVRKLRRRTLKLLSGRRKLQQRSPRVMRVPRLSLAATNERAFGQMHSVWTCRYIIVYFSPGFCLVFYHSHPTAVVFSPRLTSAD
jgi:hypothetical protein